MSLTTDVVHVIIPPSTRARLPMLKFLIGVVLGLFIGAYIAVSFPVAINNLFAEIHLTQGE